MAEKTEKDDRNNGRNIAEEIAYVKLDIELDNPRTFVRQMKLKDEMIPSAWHRVERDVPVRPRKTKITAAFDADMVRFYRAMGHGYQARMNQILRTWMLAIQSRAIEPEANRDWKGDRLRPRR